MAVFLYSLSFFSDSNEERESSPPDKEEAREKTGKAEPSFTKEPSRCFSPDASPSSSAAALQAAEADKAGSECLARLRTLALFLV